MRIKNITLFFIVLFIFSVFGNSEILNLSNLPRTSSNHPWVLAYGDKVMVVWREEGGYSGSERNIYYTIYSDGEWSKPKAAYSSPVFSKNPHIALGPDGVIHMVFSDGNSSSSREVYHMIYENGKWKNFTQIYYSPNNSNWPRVGVYSSNVPNVIWASQQCHLCEFDILRNNWKSRNSWDRLGKIVSLNTSWIGEPNLATHSDLVCKGTQAYAVWLEKRPSETILKFSQKEGTGNWTTPTGLINKYANYPGIVIDSNDNLHVIASGLGGKVYGTSRINGNWTEYHQINQGNHKKGFVDIDVDKYDNLHAVYGIGSNIYYNTANNKGVWGKEVRISNDNETHFPSISADDYGYVHIVWCTGDEGYDGDVKYTKKKAGDTPNLDSPVAIFTYSPENGVPPLEVTFDASGSYDPDGAIVSYTWNFGDGEIGSGIKPTHIFTQKGIYTITLTVMDNDGLSGTNQSSVLVTEPPVAAFTLNPTIGVAPVIVQFDASESYDPDGYIETYEWSFGDGQTGFGERIPHTYFEEGDYVITLEVFDDYGINDSTQRTLRVIRLYPPENIQFSFELNRNLFTKEYYFEITWERNSINIANNVDVVNYRVYRRVKGHRGFVELATLEASNFSYLDRGLQESDGNRYEYTVSSIDSDGNESSLEDMNVQNTQHPKIKIFRIKVK